MILNEILGLDAAPGRSKYHRTGKPTGRPSEHKIYSRPRKNLWFNDHRLWHNDLYTTHSGNFDLVTSEDEESVVASDKDRRMAYGKWDKKKNRGITFKDPRPIHTVIHPKVQLKNVTESVNPSFKYFLTEQNKREEYIAQAFGSKLMPAAHNDVSARGMHEPIQVVQALAKIDPKNGKNLQFLASKYAAGEFRFEDANRVRSAIEQFYKVRGALEKKDINQYKSIHELYDVVEKAPTEVKSNRSEKRQIKQEGSDVVLKGPNFLILHLLTGQAACYYASGTKWCTSDVGTFENYARQGLIYVIFVKDKEGNTRKFQFHYESGQVMNEKDRALSKSEIDLLSSYPEWYQFVDMMVKKHHKELES